MKNAAKRIVTFPPMGKENSEIIKRGFGGLGINILMPPPP